MADKTSTTATRAPLHRVPLAKACNLENQREADRPVPRRIWRHARYGDPPEAGLTDAPQDGMFSEDKDAASSGDTRPNKH